ncbi:hypothetical protein [Archangium lipolyticum]|uniref:hypothetical protein n=1 Tax=Archangium lipolyticum TaxID=2970465 RepID=UPI00214A14CE|nr:hypothetical protein [Archangium lipolyticum]
MCRNSVWTEQVCNTCSAEANGALTCESARVGDPCTAEGREQCMVPAGDRMMVCRSGFWTTKPCSACTPTGAETVACGAPRAGDPCSSGARAQCDTADSDRKLVCNSGKWMAQVCNSCAVRNGSVECGPARAGDACASEGKAQCDPIHLNQMLVCRERLWATMVCNACSVAGSAINCMAARKGDPCLPSQKDRRQCNPDKSDVAEGLLVCRLPVTGGLGVWQPEACNECKECSVKTGLIY